MKTRTEKIKWPESMPILKASDMYSGFLSNSNEKRFCLMGHAFRVGNENEPTEFVRTPLFEAIMDALTLEIEKRDALPSVIDWNDNHTDAENADVWNSAMRLLGYTEIVEYEA